jgi:hypothetical protein
VEASVAELAAAVVQVVAPAEDLEEALVSAAELAPAVAEDSAEAQAAAVASVVGSEVPDRVVAVA